MLGRHTSGTTSRRGTPFPATALGRCARAPCHNTAARGATPALCSSHPALSTPACACVRHRPPASPPPIHASRAALNVSYVTDSRGCRPSLEAASPLATPPTPTPTVRHSSHRPSMMLLLATRMSPRPARAAELSLGQQEVDGDGTPGLQSADHDDLLVARRGLRADLRPGCAGCSASPGSRPAQHPQRRGERRL